MSNHGERGASCGGRIESLEKIKSFTDLRAWKEAHALAVELYQSTESFPKEELFGITSQMRRAAVSITSNIAEGFSRGGYKEKTRFYTMALGSNTELQNQLLVARDVNYLENESFKKLADRAVSVNKILNGLIKTSKSRSRDL